MAKVVESTRRSDLVSRWSDLYGRDVQESREAHVLQGRVARGSEGALQFELGRQYGRAIDFGEADEIDELALTVLLGEAVALNAGTAPKGKR